MSISVDELTTPHHVHHLAYRCRDAEQTRWFWEDVMKFPLAAAIAFDTVSGTENPCEYMHLFFQMGDGNFVAFFDEPNGASEDKFVKQDGFEKHVAFEVDSLDELLTWQKRIQEVGHTTCLSPLDHGFVSSVYAYDPNGIQVEVTCQNEKYAEILSAKSREVDCEMQRWTEQTQSIKAQKFDSGKIAARGKEKAGIVTLTSNG